MNSRVNICARFFTDCSEHLVNFVAILCHGVEELTYGWLRWPNEDCDYSHGATDADIQDAPQILFHGIRANSQHEYHGNRDLDLTAK